MCVSVTILFCIKMSPLTCGVQLALFQLGLIQKQRCVIGQLKNSTHQTISCVVFLGHHALVVHIMQAHRQSE